MRCASNLNSDHDYFMRGLRRWSYLRMKDFFFLFFFSFLLLHQILVMSRDVDVQKCCRLIK